jgi:hypothetical protein
MRIIPSGAEVEFQGLYAFFGQLLTPLPLAWFVYCEDNEIGGPNSSMRIGMSSIIFFYFVGYLLMCYFFDDSKASEKAAETVHLRLRPKMIMSEAAQARMAKQSMNPMKKALEIRPGKQATIAP